MDKKMLIGIVSKSILGSNRIIYEIYAKKDTFSVVSKSMCLKPCPIQRIPVNNVERYKKLDETSFIAYVVSLDIFSIISTFC